MTHLTVSYKESISKQLADGLLSTTEYFCLVPSALYQEENKDLWLHFAKETINTAQDIQVTYITTQDCYLLWAKEDTSIAQTHIIEALLNYKHWAIEKEDSNILDYINTAICILQENKMILVLLLKGKLQIATMYHINTQEDILYHLLNIYTQWQLDANTLPTCMIGADAHTSAFINQYIAIV